MKQRKIFDGRTKGLMKMLHGKGWTYEQIARKFYCSKGTVKRYMTEYNTIKKAV